MDKANRITLDDLGREPFRIFFPEGVFAGILGVALWPLYFTGVTGFYPGQAHARIMAYGLFGGFIFGFLGTAMPRMLTAPPLGTRNVLVLFCLHVATVLAFGLPTLTRLEGLRAKPEQVLAASAPICGMTDLVVDYETTRPDLRPYSEEMMGGSPQQVLARYYERSPINFVRDIQGRLLIVQGLRTPSYRDAIRNAALGVAVGSGDTTLVAAVREAVDESRQPLYALAALALRGSQDALSALVAYLNDPRPLVRRYALGAIAQTLSPNVGLPALKSAQGSLTHPETRTAVEQVIRRLESRVQP